MQQRRVQRLRQLRELIRRGPCGARVVGGDHDFYERWQQATARRAPARLIDGEAYPSCRDIRLTLREAHQRQARLRVSSTPARFAIRLLGGSVIPTKALQLRLLIEGRGNGTVLRTTEKMVARVARDRDRIRPVAVQLHDLGATHETLARVRNQIRLRLTPLCESSGPFAGTPCVEHLQRRFDDTTVDVAREDRGYLTSFEGNHRFVEERNALAYATRAHESAAHSMPRHDEQVRLSEAAAEVGCLREYAGGTGHVPFHDATHRFRKQDVALLDAVMLLLVEKSLRPLYPPGATYAFPSVQQIDAEPNCATSGSRHVSTGEVGAVRASPQVRALHHSSREIRRGGVYLEIVG